MRIMENENKEYDNLVAEIPNHVSRLVTLKANAQGLISQIQQVK